MGYVFPSTTGASRRSIFPSVTRATPNRETSYNNTIEHWPPSPNFIHPGVDVLPPTVILSCDHNAGPHTLLPVDGSLVSIVTRSGSNLPLRISSFDRYSSNPIYAPHILRFPSNDERPCNTRWLSTATAVPGRNWTQYSKSALFNSLFQVLIASYLKGETQYRSCVVRCRPSAPFFDDLRIQTIHHAPIVVIPPHLVQLPRRRIVIQNRIPGFW